MSARPRRTANPAKWAAEAKRESKHVDFKESFDPASSAEWCELIKDFVAIANSGGGIIVVGIRDNGIPSGASVQAVLSLDPAVITDKIFKFTGDHHSGFEIHEVNRESARVGAIAIAAARTPLVFTRPGTYMIPGTAKQKNAFSQGTIYFRHGAKSEPATSNDRRDFIERRLEDAREAWLGNVRKVVETPADAQVAIYKATSTDPTGGPTRIQLTTDPNAPVYGKLDPDESHPYRQKELIIEVNKRLPEDCAINSYDITCTRTVHEIDEVATPQFCHWPKYASRQYSEPFVDWIVTSYERDADFFKNARQRYYDETHATH